MGDHEKEATGDNQRQREVSGGHGRPREATGGHRGKFPRIGFGAARESSPLLTPPGPLRLSCFVKLLRLYGPQQYILDLKHKKMEKLENKIGCVLAFLAN